MKNTRALFIIVSHGSKTANIAANSINEIGIDGLDVVVLENGGNKCDLSGNETFFVENDGYLPTALGYIKRKNIKHYEWYFVLNADIKVVELNSSAFSCIDEDVWMLSPKFVEWDGLRFKGWKVPYGRAKTLLFIMSLRNFYLFQLARVVGKVLRRITKPGDGDLDVPHGSFLGLKCDYVNYILNNDNVYSEIPFLYFEEVYLYKQLLENNKKVLFSPDIVVSHEGSGTISEVGSRFRYSTMKISYLKIKSVIHSVMFK